MVHLEGELSRLQNNMDYSMQEQRANSEIMEDSAKRDRESDHGQQSLISKQIQDKRKQFEEMLKSGSSLNERQSKDYQNQLKAL